MMTALSPCPLLTNISAIGFISKDIESRHKTFLNGVLFTLGGMCSYTILGLIIIRLLVKGASTYAVQKAISSYGELLIAPIMVVIGLAILFAHKINIGKINIGGEGLQRRARRGGWGAFMLGALFALAFCPTSGLFFFGMLMPLAAATDGGFLLPLLFAAGTALPVLIIAWIIAYSMNLLGRSYQNMQRLQQWFTRIVGLVFIGIGIYFAYIYYF